MPHHASPGRTAHRPPLLVPVASGADDDHRPGPEPAGEEETGQGETARPSGRPAGRPPGRTLREVVAEDGPLHGARLRKLALVTAAALAERHRAGTVHHALHPGNVLLGPDGAQVTGFGTCGLPGYLAPEQIEDEPSGPPADLFSWAATMTYAATGHPPFGTGPDAAVMRRVTSRPPDLTGLEATDGPLRELIARCLDKNPAARPKAGQLVRALRTGNPPTVKPRPKRIPRYRWRMMVALAAVIAAGFLLGILF